MGNETEERTPKIKQDQTKTPKQTSTSPRGQERVELALESHIITQEARLGAMHLVVPHTKTSPQRAPAVWGQEVDISTHHTHQRTKSMQQSKRQGARRRLSSQ